jgi:hypothetical protein
MGNLTEGDGPGDQETGDGGEQHEANGETGRKRERVQGIGERVQVEGRKLDSVDVHGGSGKRQ